MSDGILNEIKEKQKGIQMIMGIDYMVNDFVAAIANGNVQIKADIIALVVGNEQVQVGKNLNMAKQVERLIQQIWIVKPITQIYVASVIPKPTQETLTQAIVMKANAGLSKMCGRLTKYGQNLVKYMPVHQEFLEKWKHVDEKSGKMLKTTRICQPHSRFYLMGTDKLNLKGAIKVLDMIKEFIQADQEKRSPLETRPNLKVHIDIANTSGQEGSVSSTCGTAQGLNESKKSKRFSDDDDEKNSAMTFKKKRKSETATGNKVAKMVDKWEQLSHLSQGLSAADDIDLELGEASIVPVKLGDLEDEKEEVE